MEIEEAKKILGDTIQDDGDLYCLGHYISWEKGDKTICLDCRFDVEELEAIIVYIKHNSPQTPIL